MPLEPKQKYSSRFFAEVLCTTGAKLIEFAGQKKAKEIFTEVSKPPGERNSKLLIPVLLTRKNNAAYAALMAYSAVDIMGVKISIIKLDPRNSQLRLDECLYGDAVARQKDPSICNLCYGYNSALVMPLGVTYVRGDMIRSGNHNSCFMTYLCMNPNGGVPETRYLNLVVKVLKVLANKNDLLVSTFSSMLKSMSDAIPLTIGEEQTVLVAKNAYEAGAYLGPVFSSAAGLAGERTDAAKLVEEGRKIINCKVNTYLTTDGFKIYTRNCPLREKCNSRGFLKTTCTEYTRGLLSKYGSYEIKTGHDGETCKQDFLQSSPKTEGGNNAP